jgi:4-diphosphocytidyl-2-C-methyl-D-erythritol kinase
MKLQRAVVEAAAKVNVGLRVGPLREDGYHAVEGLVQTISLVDSLEVVPNAVPDAPLVTVVVFGFPELETEDNLVARAAHALAENVEAEPVRVVLRKSIPVAAGLGGGSADAAAALVALNAVWGAGLRPRRLIDVGARVGSDVPAILAGGLVHISGRGEVVRNVRSFTSGHVVLGVTHDGIEAAEAYAAFDRLDRTGGGTWHHNDLEEAALTLRPELRARLAAMREAAGIAFVSGSGPTIVAPVATQAEAEVVADRVRSSFDDVLIAQPVDWGVRLTLGS